MALGFCAATVIALVIGGTRHDQTAVIGLQMAITLAMLAVMWTLIGIMFTLVRPASPAPLEPDGTPAAKHTPTVEPKRVNWFQDANTGTISRR
jgi:hypothetical protein